MPETTYLELVEGHGVEPDAIHDPKTGLIIPNEKAGEPAPLANIGVNIPMPVMVGKDVLTDVSKVVIRPSESIAPGDALASRIIPGTRIVETQSPAVASLLLDTGAYAVCDPPARHVAKAKTQEASA